jgi:hypothetical protein
MVYLFEIFQAEDEEFGLEQYRDRVCVIFESGDPGGKSEEFETIFSESLSEWCGFDPEVTAQQADTIFGFDSAVQAKYVYEVSHPGESGAGIIGFTDTVTMLLESGDPGGDPGDFAEHIKLALSGWYDGAKVTKIESK